MSDTANKSDPKKQPRRPLPVNAFQLLNVPLPADVQRRMMGLLEAANTTTARLLVLLIIHDGLTLSQAAAVLNVTLGSARDMLVSLGHVADAFAIQAKREAVLQQAVEDSAGVRVRRGPSKKPRAVYTRRVGKKRTCSGVTGSEMNDE